MLSQIIIIAVRPEVKKKLHKVLLHFLRGKKCNEYYLLTNSLSLKKNFI